MCFVEFRAFQSLFFEQFNFDFKASVYLPELSRLDAVPLLDLKGIRSDLFDFVSSFRKLFRQVIVLTGKQRVLFQEGFTSGFKLIDFPCADLKDGNFIKEPSVLSFTPVCIFERDFLLNEIPLRFKDFDRRSVVRRSFAGRVSVV